ncbi:hypothetical protein QBC43DRAFT_326990 [Cladorrhinum sp. PSN259]|nr:hypothetical protein QBC43DRAFT_326990 [Cladorrhinum sp. PSN259]
MAEFAASIVAFIQLTDGVIRICSHIIGTAKDAPRDMVMISGEVTSLRAILSCFAQTELHPMTRQALSTLFAPCGPIQHCYQSIVELERLLPRNPEDPGAINRLTWALKEGKIRKLLADVSLHKSTLLLALTGDMMRDIKDIKAGIGRVEEALSRNERYEALAWLQSGTNNPTSMHLSTYNNHEEHTNSWLLKWSVWQAWLESGVGGMAARRSIWIHGIPGSGKSVMASFIIESIRESCQTKPTKRLGHAYYYFHFSQNTNQAAAPTFLRWIVGQFIRQAEWAPRQLKTLYEGGYNPTVLELLEILEQVLHKFDTVYVVVDGLDEIESRSELLAVLAELSTAMRFSKLRLLATSRPEYDIHDALSSISDTMSMSNDFVEQDIRVVVHEWITTSPRMRRWQHMGQVIEDVICARAQGMFRWVACQIVIIERIREETKLIEALSNLPKDLHQVYMRVLERVPADDRLFVQRALFWIIGHTSARRMRDQGIHIDVLVSAVCDDLLHSTGKRWNYTAEDVKELCGCFITVRALPLPYTDFLDELRFEEEENESIWHIYKKQQTETRTVPKGEFVKIAHYTVVEFLESDINNPIHRQFSFDQNTLQREFLKSILRQALAVSTSSTCVDWVRDREVYCLTLVPLFIAGRLTLPDADCAILDDPEILDSCTSYFMPTKPHFQRLRLIQCYLVAGCEDAQIFYMARLPVYYPGTPPEWYHQVNDPTVWALLAMFASANVGLATKVMNKRGITAKEFLNRTVMASFVYGLSVPEQEILKCWRTRSAGDSVRQDEVVARIRKYHCTVEEIIKSRGISVVHVPHLCNGHDL